MTEPPAAPRSAWLGTAAEALVLVALAAAPWPYGCTADPARYLLASALLLAGGAWALGLAAAGQGPPRLALAAAALPGLGALQVVLGRSAAPVRTCDAVLLLSAMLAVLVVWSDRGREPGAALRLALVVLGTCASQAVFGAVQWSVAPDRIYGQATPIVTTPFGSFVNHNHFAGFVEMGAVLAAGLALGHARRGGGLTSVAVVLAGLAPGLAAVHLASRSRGGLLALSAGLASLGLMWAGSSSRGEGLARRRVLLLAAGLAAVLGFGLVVVPASTRAHLATLLHGPGDSSGEYRVDTALATLRLAAAHPLLGAGFGAYLDALPAFKRFHGEVLTTHAESDLLELLSEGGLAGLLAMSALAALLLDGLKDRLAHGRDPLRRGIALGAAAGAVALVAHSLFDFNLRVPSNALACVALLGLAAAPRSEPRRWGTARVTATLAALWACLAGAALWRAEGAWNLERALAVRDLQFRLQALDALLARHPFLAEAHRARGLAWRDAAATPSALAALRLVRAQEDLQRAVALRPRWGEAWAELGWVRFLRSDEAGAGDALARAAALDPSNLQVSVARGDFLGRTGHASEGVHELARLRGRNPLWSFPLALTVASQWTKDRSLLLALTDGSREEESAVGRALADRSRQTSKALPQIDDSNQR